MTKRWMVLVVSIPVAAGVALWRWVGRDRGVLPAAPAAVAEPAIAPGEPASPLDVHLRWQQPEAEGLAVGREPISAPHLRGQVVDATARAAIPDVWISWTSIPLDGGSVHAFWVNPGSITDRTLHTKSDSSGAFAFVDSPPEGSGGVIWCSAPGWESNAVRWTGQDPIGPVEVVLSPREPLEVLVVDQNWQPVIGARVVHGAYVTPYDRIAAESLRKSLEVYRREFLTDGEGRVIVPPHPGYQALWAEAEPLRSSVWADRANGDQTVTLQLVPTFGLSARVLVEDESIVPESLTIVVYGEDGGVLRFLARRPVDAEGNVETFGLPVSSASGYEVCLRGEEVVPRVAPIGVFEPGGHAHVELLAQRGFEQQIKVSGPEGASIGGARVSIELQAEGFTASPFGQSDREGLARVRGMTPGSGFLFVDADGYRKFTSPQLQFLEPTAEPLQVTLMPAGVLEGRCLSEQGPVRDFEVVVWSADASPANFTSAVFDDRNDGSFRFEDVPIGDLLVLAFSAKHDLPRCEAVPVHVERGHSGRVELKLPTPQLGRGRLIDVTSGKAAVGGFLQLWANHGGQLQRPVGSPILVGADGRFEVTGFGPGDVRMQASAPGYSYVIVHARAHAGSTVEFGAIGIAPLQELDIELTAQEGVEHRSYEVSLTGQEWHPIQTILSGGIARFEDVSPGRWGLHVRGPGVEIDRWNDLLPGRSWKISIPISGFASLEARIEPRPGQLLPPGLSVEARALGARGDRTMRLVPVSDNGVARFEALEPGRHALFLLDSRKLEIGSTEVEVGYVDTTAVLPMGDAQLSVLVVSPRGLPLSGVHVQLDGAGVDSPWCQARETDRDGAATFSAVSPGAYLAGIWHSEFGWRVGIPIHVAQVRASTIQLAFEDSYELQVKLLEDGHPLPGVQVHVRDAAGRYPLVSQVSDDDGRIAHPSLARGSYALIVDQPGFWPSMAIVTLDRSREDAIMNVRSTGSLEVSWPSSPSEVLLGGSLELVDLTSAEGVSNWLSTGRIESSTGSMTADSSGRLLLEGLPRGLYRWSISGGPADGLSGEVEVTRHAKAELSISGS